MITQIKSQPVPTFVRQEQERFVPITQQHPQWSCRWFQAQSNEAQEGLEENRRGILNIIWTIMTLEIFGKICSWILERLSPKVVAAKTNSWSFNFIVCARTIRAIGIQLVMAMAATIDGILVQRRPASKSWPLGWESWKDFQEALHHTLSARPPNKPEIKP